MDRATRWKREEEIVSETNLAYLPEEVKEKLRAVSDKKAQEIDRAEMLAMAAQGMMPEDRNAVLDRMRRREKMRRDSPEKNPIVR